MTARRKATAAPTAPARSALVDVGAPIRTARGVRNPQQPQQRLTDLSRKQGRRGAPVDAPVRLKPQGLTGPITVPVNVLPQRGISAGFDPRYQCAPGEIPQSAVFGRMPIGQYLPDEPKPLPARPPAPDTAPANITQEDTACPTNASNPSPSAPCVTAPSTRARRTRKAR